MVGNYRMRAAKVTGGVTGIALTPIGFPIFALGMTNGADETKFKDYVNLLVVYEMGCALMIMDGFSSGSENIERQRYSVL